MISSGIYGYPKDEALQVATAAIQDFLINNDIDITLVVFDKSTFIVSRELLCAVESYIDEHYVDIHQTKRGKLLDVENRAITEVDEPFSQILLRLIDAKGMTDVEVYKRANLDRKIFSKIRSNKGYMPSKRTAIALAVALKLSLDETDDLLERAGYALSHAIKFDIIVEYFIVNGKYDVFAINEVLFEYDQPLLC